VLYLVSFKHELRICAHPNSRVTIIQVLYETTSFDKSRQNKHQQTVNNMVSFNTIKNFMVKFLSHCNPIQELMATLTEWFVLVKLMLGREGMYRDTK